MSRPTIVKQGASNAANVAPKGIKAAGGSPTKVSQKERRASAIGGGQSSKGPVVVADPSNPNPKGGGPPTKGKPGGKKGNTATHPPPPPARTLKPTGKTKKSCWKSFLNSLGIAEDDIVLKTPEAIEAAAALNLEQWHLKKLKRQYDKIDQDGSGSIDKYEFLNAVNEDSSAFTDKLFELIDQDGSGSIEFEEYVCVMATYCMFSKDEIMRFAFDCFDTDGSGAIDEKEFLALLKAVNNQSPTFPKNFQSALESFDTNGDGQIDFQEFLEVEKRFPIVMFPAFRLQDTMQRGSLGENAWVKIKENYTKAKRDEEYRLSHGGRSPPDSFTVGLMKTFLPCLHRERVFISVGADMLARQKDKK